MTYMGIGDLALGYRLRHQDFQLKQQLHRLSAEVTTGRVTDVAAAAAGDLSSLAGIERSLTRLGGYRIATTEAAELLAGVQSALATAQETAAGLAPGLLGATLTPTDRQVATLANDAAQRLAGVVSALNVRTGDRYLLSGIATDTPPLGPAEAILDALGPVVASQTTPQGVAAAVVAWFDAPAGSGGFADTSYRGSARPLADFRTADGQAVPMTITAAAEPLRDLMKGLALAALVDRGALAGRTDERAALLVTAGEVIAAADGDLTGLRARVGSAEAAVEASGARNAAETARLERARNDIVAADPYDAATALEAVRLQTETLYSVTARLSQLRLSEYLK